MYTNIINIINYDISTLNIYINAYDISIVYINVYDDDVLSLK